MAAMMPEPTDKTAHGRGGVAELRLTRIARRGL